MKKVILPKEIAELIEKAWSIQDNFPQVVKHLYLVNWMRMREDHGDKLVDRLADYAEDNPMEYMSALVNGYEVVKTPEENFRDYYNYLRKTENNELLPSVKRMSASNERAGVNMTLRLLDIEIEGVNK